MILLGLACAASGPDVEEFRALHAAVVPIYDGVEADGLDAGRLHAALSGSFTGEALTEQYVAHLQTARQMGASGTAVATDALEYIEITREDTPEPRFAVTWQVSGTIRHQQHTHQRTNRYQATYSLIETPDGWRIGAVQMDDLARLPEVAAPAGGPRRTALELLGAG